MKRFILTSFILMIFTYSSIAEPITHGSTTINMDFVNIGNAGNVADASGYGAVGYNYRIGTYEVTIDQFAKARAADSRVGDGDEGYWNEGTRTVGDGAPASKTSWHEGAKFANWLTTGDAYSGVYQFDGGGALTGIDRSYRNGNGLAYILPTEDEWYKAAYYKPVDDDSYSLYANGLDTVPTHGTSSGWNYYNSGYVIGFPNYMWETGFGGEEQNGTYDMMGNIWEWNESAWDGTLDNMEESRVSRGGASSDYEVTLRSSTRYGSNPTYAIPTYEEIGLGLRVAAIPEPSIVSLLGLGALVSVFARRQRNIRNSKKLSCSKMKKFSGFPPDHW